MWWAIVKCVQITVIGIILSVVVSSQAQAWSVSEPPQFVSSSVSSSNATFCAGVWSTISVDGQGSIEACVMGSGVRIASYFPIQGQISHSISFPFDSTYYPLDVCTGYWGCVYSEASDTFVGFEAVTFNETNAVVYKNFTKNLVKNVHNGSIRYGLTTQSNSSRISHPHGSVFYGQTVGVSTNGKWMVLEVRNYGFFRINLLTMDIRRVVAPGNTYTNYGPQPGVQLAISNNGQLMAVMGARMGLWLVQVNDMCGDELTVNTQYQYTGAVTPCQFLNTPTGDYISSFMHAVKPNFGYDSLSLSFDIYGYGVPPRHILLYSNEKPRPTIDYLAIGDSFTSGEGETSDVFYIGGAGNACHVSSRSYPYLVGAARGYAAHNAACSGATAETAMGNGEHSYQPNQLNEIESKLPNLVTIGIGGNDAGLIGKLKTCLGVDTCVWARHADERQNTALELKALYPKLRLFYETMKSKTSAKVVVVGYPVIISAQPVCFASIAPLLNQTERLFMNESMRLLNAVVAAAANDSGVEFISVEDVFNDSELCTVSESPSMNSIRFGDDFSVIDAFSEFKIIGAESFHPTPAGHQRVANRILENSHLLLTDYCVTCSQQKGPPEAGEYWQANVNNAKKQRMFPFLSKYVVTEGDSFQISLPGFTFKPSSDVVIELHSEVQEITSMKSTSDGSLSSSILVKNFEAGFHSVHVIGESLSGEIIDMYDFIAVQQTSVNLVPQQQNIQQSIHTRSAPVLIPNAVLNISSTPDILGASSLHVPIIKQEPSVKKQQGSTGGTTNNVLSLIQFLVAGLVLGVAGTIIGILLFSRQNST